MDVYRLKHKPTGLYFTPSRGSGNLSKKGKLYAGTKPSINWARTIRIVIRHRGKEPTGHHKTIIDHFGLNWDKWYKIDEHVNVPAGDWEIEKIE